MAQGEYQWAKFELAREKAPAARKQKDEPKKKKKSPAVEANAEEEGVERVAPPVRTRAIPSAAQGCSDRLRVQDLEEEMQGMFGGAGSEEVRSTQ